MYLHAFECAGSVLRVVPQLSGTVVYCSFWLLQWQTLSAWAARCPTHTSRILSDRLLPSELGRVIGIQDHLDDREGGEFCEMPLPAFYPVPQSSPRPVLHLHRVREILREWARVTNRERKRERERGRLLCMQWVGSSVPEGDIVGEGETAFYAWGEISFRFVLQLPNPPPPPIFRNPDARVCRDLWPVTSAARGYGRVERRKEGKVMVVTAKGSGVGALHVTPESTMYQSAQGFCPFNRAAAGRINKGGGGGGGRREEGGARLLW